MNWSSPFDPPPTEVGEYTASLEQPSLAERIHPDFVKIRRWWDGRYWSQCYWPSDSPETVARMRAQKLEWGMYWVSRVSNQEQEEVANGS